jgi:tRNA (guanine-N7-)-methyltransferase
MPRKTFAIRHLKYSEPDEATAQKYLMHWTTGDLYHKAGTFPMLTSRTLFNNDLPLELEVGCGTGEFLIHLAENEPGTNFVGIDMSLKSLYAAVETAKQKNLDNIRFVRASIHYCYPLMGTESLQAIYIHFPDPCLHPKYRKRRIFTPEFLDQVNRVLLPNGELSAMTDKEELFKIMLALIEGDTRFEKAHTERYLTGAGWEAKSRYQIAWERRGFTPMRFLVKKRAAQTAATSSS